jgi:lipid-binding SYLF domain-containing protein
MKRTAAALGERLIVLWVIVLCTSTSSDAQKLDKSKLETASKRSAAAARVITSAVSSDAIPRELFDRARAIGVFPDLDRISFVLPNSRLAYGVISSRLAEGWSPPAYYSFGAPKIPDLKWKGPKKPDVIVFFMTDQAMEQFSKGNFVFKDAMVGIPGQVGASTSEKESETRAANVIIYAIVDAQVEGLGINANELGGGAANPDNNINNGIYGMKGHLVLSGKAPMWREVLSSVADYQNALVSLSKR